MLRGNILSLLFAQDSSKRRKIFTNQTSAEWVLTDKKSFWLIRKSFYSLHLFWSVKNSSLIGWLKGVHFSSIVYEVIKTISRQFFFFFYEKILSAQNYVTSKNQLTKQK